MESSPTMTRRDLTLLLTMFLVSRLIYLISGIEFDTSPLLTGLQFIDIELLSNRLTESLIFYHAKAPLLNLIAGLGLKLFGDSADWLFNGLFHLLGMGIALSVFGLTLTLTQNRRTAFIVTTLLLFSPSFVLYENWFMYTFPTCALLTVSAWLLYKYLDSKSLAWGAAFLFCIMALVLTRALFHFYWITLVIGILIAVADINKKQFMTIAALPLLICLLWYGKNLYLFGSFSSSSLLGLSLSNVSTLAVPKESLQPLVESGELSRFATTSRYLDLPKILNDEELAPETGIPVLDDNKKSNGKRNFNSLEMKVVSEVYLEDSLKVLTLFPYHYLSGLSISHHVYFSPGSTMSYFSKQNLESVEWLTWIYNPLLYGARTTAGRIEQPHFGYSGAWHVEVNTGYTLIFLSFIILVWGSWRALATIFTAQWTARNIVIGYMFGNLLIIYLAGTFLELSENNRYRYIGEPLFWVMVVVAGSEFIRSGRRMIDRVKRNTT